MVFAPVTKFIAAEHIDINDVGSKDEYFTVIDYPDDNMDDQTNNNIQN